MATFAETQKEFDTAGSNINVQKKDFRNIGGPHGLGDPDDKSLRRVEIEVLIPKKMRDIARKEKCPEQVEAFTNCCKDSKLSMFYKCRTENKALWGCLEEWYKDKEFKARCTKEYLEERTEYRKSGITKEEKKKLQMSGF